jgi:hypothetical protein
MALGDRIKHLSKSSFSVVATAKVAKVAKVEGNLTLLEPKSRPTFATIAEIAVAGTEKKGFQPPAEIVTPAAEVNPWDWVRPTTDRQPCYAGKDQGLSCFSCKSYDGKGSSWPGMCRYPETIGRVALEIDWNVVDPVHGCGCYEPDIKKIEARDKEPDLRLSRSWSQEAMSAPSSNDKPEALPTPCREYITKGVTKRYPLEDSPKLGNRISPVALSWLAENRKALQCNCWTMAELYRRNKSRGIAWVSLWDQPGLDVVIESSGAISFHFLTATGQKIRQTAWPKKHQRKRSTKI